MRNSRWNFNKLERMRLKALICFLGLLLLIILLLGNLILRFLSSDEEIGEEVHIPVVEVYTNVWIMEADDDGVMIFRDGREEKYAYGKTEQTVDALQEDTEQSDVREQIADIVLTDGAVTDIQVKAEKINGRILSVDDASVEVEGYGKLPLAQDYKGYRIYNTLSMCTGRDLMIGYNFADIVMENGEICGLLMAREEAMESIRVLLKSSDYSGLLHEQVVLTSDTDFTIQYGNSENPMEEVHTAGEEITFELESTYFGEKGREDRIVVTPNVLTGKIILKSVNRNHGVPSYRGHMELYRTAEGIAAVNEVLLEEYLYCVVPSEMPASYPPEALQAQAVCARTYAYGHMMKAGYPQYGAHVDDSTSYQVYNNVLEQESTTTAVKETYGQLLYTKAGTLAGTFYYSTSCGVGSDANVWKTEEAKSLEYLKAKAITQSAMETQAKSTVEIQTGDAEQDLKHDEAQAGTDGSESLGERLRDEQAFKEFILSKNSEDFEVTEGWYRWTYQVKKLDVERMCSVMQKRYQANEKLVLTLDGDAYVSKPVEEFGEIHDLYISRRGVGGVADELIIETDAQTYKVISEHNIRYVLDDGESKVVRQDGSEVNAPNILPSGFFVLSSGKEKENVIGYTLSGGGFGHGVGMSQNGARNMAKCGYTSDDILHFFYDGCTIQNVYSNQNAN